MVWHDGMGLDKVDKCASTSSGTCLHKELLTELTSRECSNSHFAALFNCCGKIHMIKCQTVSQGLERPILCSHIWVKSELNLDCLNKIWVQTKPKKRVFATLLLLQQKRVVVPIRTWTLKWAHKKTMPLTNLVKTFTMDVLSLWLREQSFTALSYSYIWANWDYLSLFKPLLSAHNLFALTLILLVRHFHPVPLFLSLHIHTFPSPLYLMNWLINGKVVKMRCEKFMHWING